MKIRATGFGCVILVVALVCGVSWVLQAQSPAEDRKAAKAKAEAEAVEKARTSVATARDRAEVMHNVYASTLETMHRHYFHNNRAVLPARALEDVFEDVEQDLKISARWISVNTKPMSVEHEPKDPFERRAVSAIAGGKDSYEAVEDGFYRRAGAIPLGAGCVSCHTTPFLPPSKTQKFAALIIRVPVHAE